MRTLIRCFFLLVCTVLLRVGSAQTVPSQFAPQVKGLSPQLQVSVVDSLAFVYRKEDPALSVKLLLSAILISHEHQLDTVEIQERMNLNRQYRFAGNNDSAMMQIDTALTIARSEKLYEWEGEILAVKGVLQTRMGLYEDASATFVEGMELAKSINDSATVAQLNKNWAALFFYTTDFQSAVDRTKDALKIYTRLNDSGSVASCVDNIGLYYSNMELWDSAYAYQIKARDIFESLGDSSNLMICYNNLGSTLIKLKNFALAKSYLDKSLQMAEQRQLQYQLMTTLSTISELYHATGDRKAEEEISLRFYKIALQQDNSFYALQASESLAACFYDDGNFEKSAYYFKITDSLRQIVFDSEKTDAANDAEKKYQAKERKQEIALLEAENSARAAQNERDGLIKIIIAGALIVLLIFSAFLVRNFYRKKRDNRLLHEQNEAIEEQKAIIEVKNEEITDSISYALRIQNAVLPTAEKLNALFPDNFIYYRPRDIISGDFYWAAEGRGGMRFLAVADCTGHGVPGAMMSMLGSSILNRLIVRKSMTTPGKILDALHEELLTTLNATKDTRQVSDGMDIAVLMFDPLQKTVTIASADRPVLVVNESTMSIIAPDKISIGSSLPKNAPYTDNVISVGEGLSIFLFSDGITDQFGGPDRKKFMSKRLKELVASTIALPLQDRKELFFRTFDVWKAAMEQTDDMTLINVIIR
jgi:serine phosphatase RsbU (regulator of sigma subunit)